MNEQHGGDISPSPADLRYIDWKGWAGPFGAADPVEQRYFRRELKDVWPVHDAPAVLEVGFGSGQFLRFAKDCGADVVGVELNQHLMRQAEAAGFKTTGTMSLDDLPAEQFDLIVAFDVIEHVARDDIPNFLTTLRRLLKPDGRILFRYPNGDSWLGRINQNGDPTHVTEIGYFMMEYFCQETGLRIVDYRAQRSKNLGAGLAKRLHALFAIPLAKLIAAFLHLVYFPGSPVVLSGVNVVCVIQRDDGVSGE